ncbi:MAG: hypothetical protein H6832_14780 [Planctomycetes bacterium]|nr:hypothetical protein [Planctomycetota bacterium]
MIRTFFIAAPCCILASILPGQSQKMVPLAAGPDGSTSSPYFSGYGGGIAQQIINGSAFCRGTALLREVRLRADGSAAVPSRSFTRVRLSVGSAAFDAANMSATFASNRKGTQTVVFDAAYSLPAQTTTRPFNIVFKFTSPYVYQRPAGDLLLEWYVPQAPVKSNYFFDAHAQQAGTTGSATPFGTAGKFASNDSYGVTSDPGLLQPGGAATLIASGLKSAYPAISFWGFSNTMFGVIPLPFDLTPLQAPGNSLNVSIDLAFALPLVAQGATYGGESALPIPYVDALVGATIHAQALFVDPASNPRGWVLSQGVTMTIGRGGIECNHVGHYDYQSATGSISRTPYGLVTELYGVFN